MASINQIEAKRCFVEISDGAATPTWTQVGGLNNLGTSFPASDTDVTTFDTAGWTAKVVMERGLQLKLGGFLKVDSVTGVQDSGQSQIEAAGFVTGAGSVKDFRLTIPRLPDLSKLRRYSFSATVSLDDQGGGNNDLVSWGATLQSYGTVARADI